MHWLKYTSVGIKTTLKVNNYTYTKQNTQKRTKSNIYQGPLSGIKYVISPLQNILVIGFWWTQLIPYKAIWKNQNFAHAWRYVHFLLLCYDRFVFFKWAFFKFKFKLIYLHVNVMIKLLGFLWNYIRRKIVLRTKVYSVVFILKSIKTAN